MAQQFPKLDEKLKKFIAEQKIFFTATAPREGRVNTSPKGMDSLRVLSDTRLIWLNLTGSGNESAAHVLENERMTLMWCSFDKAPLILRVYAKAKVVHDTDEEWPTLSALLPSTPGARQIFDLEIAMVQTSCGFAVPHMNFESERKTLERWADTRGPEGLQSYWEEKNLETIDGLDTGMKEVLSGKNKS